MKWLIVGTGSISDSMIKALRDEGEFVFAGNGRTEQKLQNFASKHSILSYSTNFDDILNFVDAVYVATPNAFHYDYALKSLKAGKHVLCEKIMTDSYSKTKELFENAKLNNVKLMEVYTNISDPVLNKLKWKKIQANFMRVSSKIKNNSWREASTFSADAFGGALSDIGVYPLALAINNNGLIDKFDFNVNSFLNGVEVDIEVSLIHTNGSQTNFRASKIKDGNNKILIDGEVTELFIGSNNPLKMNNVVKDFISGNELSKKESVSVEVARVVCGIKEEIGYI